MKNSTPLPDWHDCDGCPVHSTRARKVYTFGQYADAEVTTFAGCRCAVAEQLGGGSGLEYPPRYFSSYGAAEGLARLVKAVYADKYG